MKFPFFLTIPFVLMVATRIFFVFLFHVFASTYADHISFHISAYGKL